MQRKVLLAAIAKDEGAYIPEWIYYHLLVGFAGIEIYVNQTRDQSYEILSRISKRDGRVKFRNADYLLDSNYALDDTCVNADFLKRNAIQARAYNEILKNSHGLFSHVMFLDLDEFYISLDGNDINQFLSKHDYDVISLNWFNQSGDSQAFEFALKTPIRGEWRNQFKSIVKLPEQIETVTVLNSHQILVEGGISCELGPEELEEKANSEKIVDDRHLILHRWLRSEKEYLALIFRGDTFRNASNGFKLSRSGWTESYKVEITIPSEYATKIHRGFQEFVPAYDIEDLLNNSRDTVLDRAETLRGKFLELDHLHENLKNVLSGTSLNPEEHEQDHTEMFRDCALLLEDIALPKASALMALARESRPFATRLKNKDVEYRMRLKSKTDVGMHKFMEVALLLEVFDIEKAHLIMNLLKKSKPNDKFIQRKIREYKKHKNRESNFDIAIKFRDAAVFVEKKDKQLAMQLMKIAQAYNPKGPFIIGKIEEYSEQLERPHIVCQKRPKKWWHIFRRS